jgi:hypothetical protein
MEEFDIKYAKITTIYNQYLIRNCLQKVFKNGKKQGLGLVDQESSK